MPAWVRIVLIFFNIFLIAWILISPRLLVGHMVARTDDGRWMPVRGLEMHIMLLGRVHKFKTNEDGYWFLPLASAFPNKLDILVRDPDLDGYRNFQVDTSDIWVHDVIRVEKIDDDPYFRVGTSLAGLSAHESHTTRLSYHYVLFDKAHARNQFKLAIAEPPKETGSEDIIISIIAKILNKSTRDIEPESNLYTDLNARYLDIIGIILNIESEFKISIPDEHWKNFRTVQDIRVYVKRWKFLTGSSNIPSNSNILNNFSKKFLNLPVERCLTHPDKCK
ncbi:MAG: acyl carrier protein [Hyphomicrobiales bacterium]|nr:acyl carrier protein [Hyphomicrobiales bacterium]